MLARVARPLTLIAALPEALCTKFSRHDLADKLLSVLTPDVVSCLQFVPKRYVRITLKTFEARQAVLQSGIAIDSSSLTVFEADPVTVEVSVEHLPFEVTDEDLRDALSPFGAILDVRLQTFASSGVPTGTRLVTMSLASDIPFNLRVLRYPCRVLYRGQPRPCPICRGDDHRASSCPLRDKCRLCFQPGHFARDCDYDPSFVVDEDAEDDDDECGESDVSDEFVSGDEEVVEVAPAPSLPSVSSSAPSSVEREVSAVTAPPPSCENVPAAAPAAAPVAAKETEPSDSIASRVKRRIERVTTSDFRWIARFPKDFRDAVSESGHTPDSHVIQETFFTSDHKIFRTNGILDFGVNTYRILKDVRTFEDLHLRSFEHGFSVSRSSFPGPRAGVGGVLSPDVDPLQFPGCV